MDTRTVTSEFINLNQARQYLNELKKILQEVSPCEQNEILGQLQELNARYVYQDFFIPHRSHLLG